MSGSELRTSVLVVGMGPVGLVLAAELGSRGINTVALDRMAARGSGSPRIMQIGVRTMELCRRFGIAQDVYNWGFPRDYPMDSVFLVENLNGQELARSPLPSLAEAGPSRFSPEYQAHCPQPEFEPIWERVVAGYDSVTRRYGCEVRSLAQDADGVDVVAVDAAGDELRIRADYVVGCDGAGSRVRSQLGIELLGQPLIDHSLSVEFYCDEWNDLHDKRPAVRYVCIDEQGTWGTVMAVDGKRTWRVLLYGDSLEALDEVDPDAIVTRLMGRPVDYQLSAVRPWVRSATLAERYRAGRVFLAGDAGHVHPPNGGFGMNTGVIDAANLGWKLAAVIDGWAPDTLLDSYEQERRPIARIVIDEALGELSRITEGTKGENITLASPAGERGRKELAARIQALYGGERGWLRFGIHLGYVYESGAVIADAEGADQVDDWFGFEPSTRPGVRAPHAWLGPGKSTLDLYGDGFVLLVLAGGAEYQQAADRFRSAARDRSLPLTVHTLLEPELVKLYETPLVLVRPDGHVAWRAATAADDAAHVLDVVRT
jgi:2-polyprenyl-6-methoxyphenol hydroxylase-like FAD-dependent oxidoreductase